MALPYTFANGTLANATEVNANFAYVDKTDIISQLITQQLQQDLNILINSASGSALYDYDDMFLDITSDANGYDNTIDTGSSDSTFVSNYYINQGSILFVEAVQYTESGTTYVLKKTWSSVNATVEKCTNDIYRSGGGTAPTAWCKHKYRYSDLTTADVEQSSTTTGYGTIRTYTNPFPAKTVSSIDIYLKRAGGDPGANMYMNYNTVYAPPSDKFFQTNAQTITADPVAHQVFATNVLTGTGATTYDISFDGGTTWVTGQALNTYNTSVHSGSSLKLRLNSEGTGVGNQSKIYNYASMLFY